MENTEIVESQRKVKKIGQVWEKPAKFISSRSEVPKFEFFWDSWYSMQPKC